jgi:hypothetical protein
MLPFRLELGPSGRLSFRWTTEALIYNIPRPSPHRTHRTLLSYSAPQKNNAPRAPHLRSAHCIFAVPYG